MQEGELKKMVNDVEGIYLRDKKLHELDDNLFYVVEERQNSVDLCDKGRELLSKKDKDLFIVQSLDEILQDIDANENLNEAEKARQKEISTIALWIKARNCTI